MKYIEIACVFSLIATLAGCDSKAPKPNSDKLSESNSTAKLSKAAPESGGAAPPAAGSVHEDVKGDDTVKARYSPALNRCLSTGDAATGVAQPVVECTRAETERQDKTLNAEYRKASDGLETEQRPKLVTAQRAWIAYRDGKCRSENLTGGSADFIGEPDCLLYETVRRTIELEDMQGSLADPPKKPAKPDPVEARYTPVYDKCLNTGAAAQGQTLAMVECTSGEIVIQDKALNGAYGTALATLEVEKRPELVKAQRAWIAFRAGRCAAENQSGGTIDNILIGACILHETVRRTMELEAMR